MTTVKDLGLQNQLMRWVRRHTRMATLFPANRKPTIQRFASGVLAVQQDHPTQPDENGTQVVIQQKPNVPVIVSVSPQIPHIARQPISNTASAIKIHPNATPDLSTSETDVAQAIARAETPPARLPPQPQSKPSASVDQVWKRLENILHKHQEKQGLTKARTDTPPIVAREDEPTKTSQGVPVPIQRSVEQLRSASTLPATEVKSRSQVNVVTEQPSEPPANPVDEMPTVIESTRPDWESRDKNALASPLSNTAKENTVFEQGVHPVHSRGSEKSPLSSSEDYIIQEKPFEESPSDTFAEPGEKLRGTVQAVPLEFAWPVQKTSLAKDMPIPAGDTGESSTVVAPNSTDTPINEIATRPASELVAEVLPPSRPRPTLVQKVSPPSAVQRRMADELLEESDTSPSMVQTAIGPLPADLWRLIGEKPPDQSSMTPSAKTMNNNREEVVSRDEGIQHEVRPSVVQRQSLPALPSKPNEEPIQDDMEKEPTANLNPNLDIGELSRHVYTELRRRLTIEAERSHKRM